MVLKKQTVWLLTMLSLIVVLSVYYILPGANGGDLAAVDTEEMGSMENDDKQAEESDKEEGDEADGDKADGDEEAPAEGANDADQQDSVVNVNEVFEEAEEGAEMEGTVANPETADVFAMHKLSLIESRHRAEEENNNVVSAPESSPSEVSLAMDKTKELQQLAQLEEELERAIQIDGGYENVLVLMSDGAVEIHVQAEELTKEDSVKIMDIAGEKVGRNVEVAVNYTK
ncbi:SpoIIIAH-like family protein [Alkalihalobacillus sp. 1P02AB]|uniref:SpoIIIAH-like family protein n=1 Tax=Alkalihalobacillus sp. 1P02AB TaxID=3132260 RepID=UPI0039A5B687